MAQDRKDSVLPGQRHDVLVQRLGFAPTMAQPAPRAEPTRTPVRHVMRSRLLYFAAVQSVRTVRIMLLTCGARGLEPPAPCLQSDVFVCRDRADLASQLSVSSREIPLPSPNGA